MNKLAIATEVIITATGPVYSGLRWYLWDGGFFALGKSEGVVPLHQHHAIQIVIGVEGEIGIKGTQSDWQSSRGVIVRPDVEHSFDGQGALGAMVFVDPESVEGIWLRSSLGRDITIVPESRLEQSIGELRTFIERPFESTEIGALIRQCVHSLCSGAPPARKLDPRVTLVLKTIRALRGEFFQITPPFEELER